MQGKGSFPLQILVNMDVSVIIVNHNTAQLTMQALSSLLVQSTLVKMEVIVVDSGSDEPTDSLSSFCEENHIRFELLGENVGFGRANNHGAQLATGRNLFFLNPDTYLVNDAVAILSDYLDQHDKVAACGGNLYTENISPAHSYHTHFPSILQELDFITGKRLLRLFGDNSEFNEQQNPRKVAYVCGADLMMKREVFEKLGGFSPDFFLYYEESDLQCRAAEIGYEIHSVPQARIVHLEGKSFGLSETREKRVFNGRKVYFEKHHNSLYHGVANAMNVVALLVGFAVNGLLGRGELRDRYRFRLKLYMQG